METVIRHSAALLPWVPVALFMYWFTAGVPPTTACVYTGIALVAAYTLTILWTLLERWRRRNRRSPIKLVLCICINALSPVLPIMLAFLTQHAIHSISAYATESVTAAIAAIMLTLGFSLALSVWAWKSLATETKGVDHVLRRR